MAFPTYPAGRVTGSRGVIPNQTDYKRFNSLPLQALYDGFLSVFYGEADGTPVDGFFGDSLTVEQVSGRTYQLLPGIGFQYYTGAGPASDEPRYRMIHVAEAVEFTVAAAPSGTDSRIDLVIVKADEAAVSESRDVKDLDASPTTVAPQSVDVMKRPSRGSASVYLQGVAGPSPSAPAVPSGYIAVARLDCAGEVDLEAITITDLRTKLPRRVELEQRSPPSGTVVVGGLGWTPAAGDDATIRASTGVLKSSYVGAGWKSYFRPLDLPPGATLSEMRVESNRAATGGTFNLVLRRQATNGTLSTIKTIVVTNATGDQSDSDAMDHVVDRDGYDYILEARYSNPAAEGDLTLYSIAIDWSY